MILIRTFEENLQIFYKKFFENLIFFKIFLSFLSLRSHSDWYPGSEQPPRPGVRTVGREARAGHASWKYYQVTPYLRLREREKEARADHTG